MSSGMVRFRGEGVMTKTVLGSVVAAAWCVAAPLAQQQPAPTPNAAPAHNVFVLTGCLKAGTDATATFRLTDASTIGQQTPAGSAEGGAAGTSGQKAATYELKPVSAVTEQGLNADALKAHLGRRVEVIVRPVESQPAAPPAGLAGVQAAKPSEPKIERFTVTELKRVTGTCS
jgi:hypothetical protein